MSEDITVHVGLNHCSGNVSGFWSCCCDETSGKGNVKEGKINFDSQSECTVHHGR